VAKLQEQLLTLVWRGVKIDHQPGDHDDYANACAGAAVLAAGKNSYEWTWEAIGGPKPGDSGQGSSFRNPWAGMHFVNY
jgi:hypothetical protein